MPVMSIPVVGIRGVGLPRVGMHRHISTNSESKIGGWDPGVEHRGKR
jgi:hypothetical protein